MGSESESVGVNESPVPEMTVPTVSEPEPLPLLAQQPELPIAEERKPTPQEEKLLTRLQALWPDIIANIREKSAFLGSVLVSSRPSKLLDQTLTIGFTARDGFQREMLEDPEYRELLEKELNTMLRQEVTVICQTSDAGGNSRRS